MKPIRVRIILWKIVALICTLLFSAFLMGSAYQHAYGPAAGFGIFTLLGLILLLGYGPVELNADGIEMDAPVGTYFIRWDEVRRVRFGRGHLVLDGDSKRLTVPVPGFWGGSERVAALEALTKFLSASQIVPQRSAIADLLLSKNAKRA